VPALPKRQVPLVLQALLVLQLLVLPEPWAPLGLFSQLFSAQPASCSCWCCRSLGRRWGFFRSFFLRSQRANKCQSSENTN